MGFPALRGVPWWRAVVRVCTVVGCTTLLGSHPTNVIVEYEGAILIVPVCSAHYKTLGRAK